MRLDDLRSSSNVDDRRGMGGGGRMIAGGGGLGLVAIVVISLLFGVNPSDILNQVGGEDTERPAASSGPRADDADFDFAKKIVGSAEDIWSQVLAEKGVQFTPATLTTYDYQTQTGCGTGQSSAGPFYCPNDARIYLDLSFFGELSSRFGAPGDFAQAYVIAHEYGHHIQNLVGTMDREQSELQGDGARGENGASVRLELQADCYAGVWANKANARFKILQTGDVEEGLKAASAVGDDTLEKESQGYVVPDSFTHGTSAQRMRWFKQGLDSGDMDRCDTFSAASL
jgi:predicted metalloprotease